MTIISAFTITTTIAGLTVSGGYAYTVVSAGQVDDSTIEAGGILHVLAAGQADGVTILSGGEVDTGNSGFQGSSFTPAGIASGTIVDGYFLNRGTAYATTIGNGGTLDDYFGGMADGVTVAFGGVAIIDLNSTATNITVSSGGEETIIESGTATSTTVASAGFLAVSVGMAGQTTLLGGGRERVFDDGVASATTVSSGASLTVQGELSFGTASGTEYLFAESIATQLQAYAVEAVGPGIASATTVSSGGLELVGVLSNGTSVHGSAVSTTVLSGGAEVVQSGGTEIDPTVNDGGYLVLLPGSVLSGPANGGGQVVSTGVVEIPASGAITVGATLTGETTPVQYVLFGGVASSTTVTSESFVYGGGTADGNIIDNLEYVYSGGQSDNALVGDEAQQIIASGGIADGAVVSAGIFAFGTFSFPISGKQDGGTAENSIVDGQVMVSSGGTVINVTVNSGGEMLLASGAIVSGLVLDSGSTQTLSAGYSVTNPILAGGTLVLESGSTVSGSIDFSGSGGLLTVSGTITPSNTIVGFAPGDGIQLAGIVYVPTDQVSVISNGVVAVEVGSTDYDFNIDGATVGETDFQINSGLLLTRIPCYVAGTNIATPQGEVPVERLAIGDRVRTASGMDRPIKWIGRRSYAGRFAAGARHLLPIRVSAGALADQVPHRDLLVSPKHAMFLDGVLIPAERLVNGSSIRQETEVDALHYFHIELDSHDILLAEGAAAESFVDCDSRGMFANANEFAQHYPDDSSLGWAFCAPRLEEGEIVEAVRQRLAARAGLTADHVDDAAEPGPLDGWLDRLDRESLAGWAFDATRPHTPVHVEILVDGNVVGEVVANLYRPDVEAAGKGDGRCGYFFRFPPDDRPLDAGEVHLRRSSDHAPLRRPWTWPHARPDCATGSTAALHLP
jgi:autotransporter passenger strand-loop-strand repeat protein